MSPQHNVALNYSDQELIKITSMRLNQTCSVQIAFKTPTLLEVNDGESDRKDSEVKAADSTATYTYMSKSSGSEPNIYQIKFTANQNTFFILAVQL